MAELRPRDRDSLIGNIQRGQSVLFVGPHLGPRAEAAMTGLTRHLAGILREEGEAVEGQSLPAVAQQFEARFGRNDLVREAEQFYGSHRPSPSEAGTHARLAALSFPLYVTTGHDRGLERALQATSKVTDVGHYHFRGGDKPLRFANTPGEPLLYYLHGAIIDPSSLVLTERDVLEFLERIVARRPGVPAAIHGHLQKQGTTFLFLGFGLRHPYLRVLLHALKINQADRSFAVEGDAVNGDRPDDTVLFYQRGKITLYDIEVSAFVEKLAQGFRDAGGALPSPQLGLTAVRARVFISYASEDANQARRLLEGLEGDFEVWLDKARLQGGDRWDPTIKQAIDESDYVLILQSRALVARADGYVNTEIALARERATRVAPPSRCIIPVEIEPGELRQDLRDYQAHSLSPERYGADLQELASNIKRDYQKRHRERPF